MSFFLLQTRRKLGGKRTLLTNKLSYIMLHLVLQKQKFEKCMKLGNAIATCVLVIMFLKM